jgi:hypothetical protein
MYTFMGMAFESVPSGASMALPIRSGFDARLVLIDDSPQCSARVSDCPGVQACVFQHLVARASNLRRRISRTSKSRRASVPVCGFSTAASTGRRSVVVHGGKYYLQARGASAPEYEDHRSTVSVEVAGVGPLTPQRHPGLQWRCQYEAGRQRAEGQRKSPVPSSTSCGTVLHHHRLFCFL